MVTKTLKTFCKIFGRMFLIAIGLCILLITTLNFVIVPVFGVQIQGSMGVLFGMVAWYISFILAVVIDNALIDRRLQGGRREH